jgi:hypothetical protein
MNDSESSLPCLCFQLSQLSLTPVMLVLFGMCIILINYIILDQISNLFLFCTISLVIHYQYQSICRGGQSILEVLEKQGVEDPSKYIGFYALRAHDELDFNAIEEGLGVLEDEKKIASSGEQSGAEPAVPQAAIDKDPTGTYITEELYIHSKLLIADDRIVICGSGK